MPVSKIVNFCEEVFDSPGECNDCQEPCSGSCNTCLDDMHFLRTRRRYECSNITCYYVCKYIFKYASEVERLLEAASVCEYFDKIRVLSFGCGPASELYGLANYIMRHEIQCPVRFIGIDFNNVWERIHSETRRIFRKLEGFDIRSAFRYINGLDFLRNRPRYNNPPNMLVLQYLLSDMHGHGENVTEFIDLLVDNVVSIMPAGSFIFINDINHYNARDHFEEFYDRLTEFGDFSCHRYHFRNPVREFTFSYGQRHSNNRITIEVPDNILELFDPWTRCSSAQMVIIKDS